MKRLLHRLPRPRALTALILAAAFVAGLITLGSAVRRVLEGKPYPVAEPMIVGERLGKHSQMLYDGLRLTGAELEKHGNALQSRACMDRHLWSIDEVDLSTLQLNHRWALLQASAEEAESAVQRVRKSLSGSGWRLESERRQAHDGLSYLDLRMRHPKTRDLADVSWNDSRNAVFVTLYSDCFRYPATAQKDHLGFPLLPVITSPSAES